MSDWKCVLELDEKRALKSGDPRSLAAAIRRGADLRVCTAFRHNEHIDVTSSNPELIQEAMDFRITYLLDDRWTAGILNLRQPVSLPDGFGPRPSMSFFLYNQDGSQAIARPFLDGVTPPGKPGASPAEPPPNMPKYHAVDSWDAQTNAPSSNFVFDFEYFRFIVRDDWQEVLAHDGNGEARSGSVAALADASACGREIKVAVSGLGEGMAAGENAFPHEVFVHAGSCYYYTGQKLFITGSQPVVRVRPDIPLRYSTGNWDCGWLVLRTDGRTVYRRCDPYTLKFNDMTIHCAMRWFVR